MRSIIRTLTVVLAFAILSSSIPASASEQVRGTRLRDREKTPIIVVIKRLVKKFFGIAADEELTVPKPNQNQGQG